MTMSKGHIEDIYIFNYINDSPPFSVNCIKHKFVLDLKSEYKLKELINIIDFDSLINKKCPFIINIDELKKIITIKKDSQQNNVLLDISNEYIINTFNTFIINLINNYILKMSLEFINRIEITFYFYSNTYLSGIYIYVFPGSKNYIYIEIKDNDILNIFNI